MKKLDWSSKAFMTESEKTKINNMMGEGGKQDGYSITLIGLLVTMFHGGGVEGSWGRQGLVAGQPCRTGR